MFTCQNYCLKSHTGLTLIELMIALFITTFILFFIVSIFITAEKNHNAQIAVNQISENIKVANNLLQKEIHSAGYIGCAHLSKDSPVTNHSDITFNINTKIISAEIAEATPGTNALTVMYASSDDSYLVNDMRSNSIMYINKHLKIFPGEIILISNCKSADIFIVKEVEAYSSEVNKVFSVLPLQNRYEKMSRFSPLEVNTYYVSQTRRIDARGFPIHALYLIDINKNKSELIEGIEDFKVHIDQDNKKNSVGVGISILVKSTNDFALEKNGFIYAISRN